MYGLVGVLNVREHSYLIQLSKNKDIDMIGINYKDESSEAMGWLSMREIPIG